MENSALILIVEDQILIATDVENSLQEGGFETHLADNGKKAIALLEGGKVSVAGLVTDIDLGAGPDGWNVAQRARELNPLIPIVYMSGHQVIEHASKGVPASLMVQKPFAAVQIVTAISQLLNALPALSGEPTA